MNLNPRSRRLAIALAAAAGMALSGCAMHDRHYDRSAQGSGVPAAGSASTPAMQPDRYSGHYDNRPRSFSDPGPMYPDTGR